MVTEQEDLLRRKARWIDCSGDRLFSEGRSVPMGYAAVLRLFMTMARKRGTTLLVASFKVNLSTPNCATIGSSDEV